MALSGNQKAWSKSRLKRLRDADVDVRGMDSRQVRNEYARLFGATLSLESCLHILNENWAQIKATGRD